MTKRTPARELVDPKSDQMKIVVVGDWHSEVHEEPVYRALRQLGHIAVRFSWHQYFKPSSLLERIFFPAYKFQNKYLLGPLINRLNRDLVGCIEKEKPDAVFVYRGTHILPRTLKELRKVSPETILVGYNNDDPFSPLHPGWRWRLFLAGVPEYDLVLAYRPHNIADFQAAGAKQVKLLRSWYLPEVNHPIRLNDEDARNFTCDVVFAGHYEDDGRLRCLEEIVRRGWKLNLFGPDFGWHPALRKSSALRSFVPLRLVWGKDYNKAICGAKVALCFLSKLNRDTYTRRCFEIPASGTLLLTEYSDDLAGLFEFGKEADSFRTPDELLDKLDLYLRNDRLRMDVAAAGRRRVVAEGHDVVSRTRQLVTFIQELQENRECAN
ncbi:MAG: glycosyltransferase [Desulfomonile tiedjei]|nr:glycosyltransferase [Desulfomonile tiedjei]